MPNAFTRSSPLARNDKFSSVVGPCSPAHELFGSRKLRLAPQDYSPWTPPLDRFLVRSYPPASRHPSRHDLGPTSWSPVHLKRMRAKVQRPVRFGSYTG